MTNDRILKGLKVQTHLEPGYVFAPYIPVNINPMMTVLPKSPWNSGPWIYPAETTVYRKTDCLVVGEMYRIEMSGGRFTNVTALYKEPSINSQYQIGRVKHNQVVTYLGESVFELLDDGREVRMSDDRWYYKVFADDQVGYVYGPVMRLVFLKVELANQQRQEDEIDSYE